MTAPRIVLGQRPRSFPHEIVEPLIEGGEGSIAISYVYRTAAEFAALLDETFASARASDDPSPTASQPPDTGEALAVPALSGAMTGVVAARLQANVAYILQIADGWDLGVPFDRETVAQLCAERPAFAHRIIGDYRAAILEGRLGNSGPRP